MKINVGKLSPSDLACVLQLTEDHNQNEGKQKRRQMRKSNQSTETGRHKRKTAAKREVVASCKLPFSLFLIWIYTKRLNLVFPVRLEMRATKSFSVPFLVSV